MQNNPQRRKGTRQKSASQLFAKPQPFLSTKTRGNTDRSHLQSGNTDHSHFQAQKPGPGTGNHRSQTFTKPIHKGITVRSHFQVQKTETTTIQTAAIFKHKSLGIIDRRHLQSGNTDRSHFQAQKSGSDTGQQRGNTDRSHFQAQKPGPGTGFHKSQPFTALSNKGNTVRSHFQVQKTKTDKGKHKLQPFSSLQSSNTGECLDRALLNTGLSPGTPSAARRARASFRKNLGSFFGRSYVRFKTRKATESQSAAIYKSSRFTAGNKEESEHRNPTK